MSTPRNMPLAQPDSPAKLKIVHQSKAANRLQRVLPMRPLTESEIEALFRGDTESQVAVLAAVMVAEAPSADDLRTHPAWR